MSPADMTSQEDLDDAAFRALLAPLALEVLPGRRPAHPPEPGEELCSEQQSRGALPDQLAADFEPDQPSTEVLPVDGPPEPLAPDDGTTPPPDAVQQERLQQAGAVVPEPAPTTWEILPGDEPHIRSVPADRSPLPSGSAVQFVPFAAGALPDGRWQLTTVPPAHLARRTAGMPDNASGAVAAISARLVQSPSVVRPYQASLAGGSEHVSRQIPVPRLVARAGAPRQIAMPGGTSRPGVRSDVLPPARIRWNVVLLSGLASALAVAALSWLFTPSLAADQAMVAPASVQLAADPPLATAPPTRAAPHSWTPAEPAIAAAAVVPAQPSLSMIGVLTQRADAELTVGDIVAARLLFERAAALGSATAATAVGKTYDNDFLRKADTHGIRPDPAAALAWYRKGAALGDPEARQMLARITAQTRP